MSYMWDEFNIKTFPAETAVFRNGVFCPELSTIVGCDINRKYARPVHIIYVGEIAGNCRLDVNINVDNQNVFIDVRIKNKLPAFFNIFIKNAGKNSECRGHILMENYNDLKYECMATHVGDDTTILVKNKLVAGRNTKSKLSAVAIIEKNSKNAISDIGFSAMADKTARIEFTPAQRILSIPNSAEHSASIYRPSSPQIQYLRMAGLSGAEVDTALGAAFMNDFSLF